MKAIYNKDAKPAEHKLGGYAEVKPSVHAVGQPQYKETKIENKNETKNHIPNIRPITPDNVGGVGTTPEGGGSSFGPDNH